MKNNTEAVKVTLRPAQIKKVKILAKTMFENNFSMALRFMVNYYDNVEYVKSFKDKKDGI